MQAGAAARRQIGRYWFNSLSPAARNMLLSTLANPVAATLGLMTVPPDPFGIKPEGSGFSGRFVCPRSGVVTVLRSSHKQALVYGLNFLQRSMVDTVEHLEEAGLEGGELYAPLAIIRAREVADAIKLIADYEARELAKVRSKELLRMCLTPEQREDLERHQRFTVNVAHDLKDFPVGVFHISMAHSFNVRHVETGERFCVTALDCPIYDQMLTQKLLLEQDPERFFKTANREHGGVGWPMVGGVIYFGPDEWRNVEWRTDVQTSPREPNETNREWTRNAAEIEARYPGFRQTIATPEFQQWLRRQPPHIQRLAESQSAGDALNLLGRYTAQDLQTTRNAGNTIRFRRWIP